MTTVFTAAQVITPIETIENGAVEVRDGRVQRVGTRDQVKVSGKHVDLGDAVLAPGYVDIHIHGGAGHDVMEGEDSALDAIERSLAKHGVTSYCPTTVTASMDKTLFALEKLGKRVKAGKQSGRATPLGLHLEGPFISTAKCGVHPVSEIVAPSLELFDRFWQASQGTVSMMTVAPELPGAAAFIREVARRGIRVSLGHSDAKTTAALAAVDAGASHATHSFNAMRALDHREPGILGVVLSDDRLSADIIADGVHLASEITRLFLTAKGDERAVLITDAISATGMPEGRYSLGSFMVEVNNGKSLLNGRIAGSVLTMDLAVRNIMAIADYPLRRAVGLASRNAAAVLGLETQRGVIAPGAVADFVVLDRAGHVQKTFISGESI